MTMLSPEEALDELAANCTVNLRCGKIGTGDCCSDVISLSVNAAIACSSARMCDEAGIRLSNVLLLLSWLWYLSFRSFL